MTTSVTFSPNQGDFFLESEIGKGRPEVSFFHILPLPFEASVSYVGGTSNGPEAILQASQQLELYDGYDYPAQAGIFTHAPLNLENKEEPHIINSKVLSQSKSKSKISDKMVAELFNNAMIKTGEILKSEAFPIILGGEHSISYGPIMAAAEHYGGDLGIVQIDAHADMRLAYEGRVWSHASVMRRCADRGIPILQLGTRALCKEEVEYRRNNSQVYHYDARDLAPGQVNQIEYIDIPDSFPTYLYLTIDVDGFDPSVFPATGTPVPGGLLWYQTLSLLDSIIRQRRIVAFDLVELAPGSAHHASEFTAAQLVYNVMGFIQRQNFSLRNQ